jgi:hypothetical protein
VLRVATGTHGGTATRRTRRTAARRHAHNHGVKGSSGAREGGKPRFSRRGEGVVVAGLTKEAALCSCSRRRPAPRTVPGPAFSSWCGRSLPTWRLVRHLLAAVGLQQRRAGNGGRTAPSFPPPLPFPPCSGAHRNGKPQSGLVGFDSDPGGLSIWSRSRRCRGKDDRGRSHWRPWRGGRRGSTPVVAGAPLASPSEGKGVNSPWRNLLDRVAHARASLGVRASSPQPSHPARRALGGAVELGAERGKVEEDRGEGG